MPAMIVPLRGYHRNTKIIPPIGALKQQMSNSIKCFLRIKELRTIQTALNLSPLCDIDILKKKIYHPQRE